jgi:drug/metabolite transporter (DMT)-like permease
VLFGALFLKSPILWSVVLGGAIGIGGVGLIFAEELSSFDLSDKATVALVWLFFGAMMASLGNIASQRNQRAGLPVLQTNAYGMLYGAVMMFALALATSTPLSFDFSFPYIASLIYLSLFGSIIAFGAYLTLIGNIGADKAGYIALLIPIIALLLSTVFEDYHWPPNAIAGVALVILGNLLALHKKRSSA